MPGRFLALCSVLAAAVCAAGCRPCERDRPCLDWVELGETYSVELVQHIDMDPTDGTPYPFGRVQTTSGTCGRRFDLEVGSTIELVAERKNNLVTADQCNDCYYVSARPTIESLTIERLDRENTWLGWLGTPDFSAVEEVTVGVGCTGTYSIGVTPVRDFYLRSGEYIASDYVLFRGFDTVNLGPCLVEGSRLTEGGGRCWDAWAVRIRDSSGRLVTKDLAPPAGWDGGSAAIGGDGGP